MCLPNPVIPGLAGIIPSAAVAAAVLSGRILAIVARQVVLAYVIRYFFACNRNIPYPKLKIAVKTIGQWSSSEMGVLRLSLTYHEVDRPCSMGLLKCLGVEHVVQHEGVGQTTCCRYSSPDVKN